MAGVRRGNQAARLTAIRLRVSTQGPASRYTPRSGPDARATLTRRLLLGVGAAAAIIYSEGIARAVQVMQDAEVDLPQAIAAVHAARRTNATGAFVLAEGVDKALAISQAAEADAPGSVAISSIRFTAVGGVTSAVVTTPIPGVTVQYTVSGTDGYYDSGTLQTDARGSVSFNIPTARAGVEDAVSVTAVLSGRTASTRFLW